jgi:hypothetical protein
VENSLATSVGPGEILEYQYLSWRCSRYLWRGGRGGHKPWLDTECWNICRSKESG